MSTASLLLAEAQKGPKEFVQAQFEHLLSRSSIDDRRATNEDNQTLHMLLAYNGHEMAFNKLSRRCPPNVLCRESYEGRVLAHFAIQHADDASRHAKARILGTILVAGGDPNAVDNPGSTIDPQRAPRSLLDYAISEGCLACVRVLLKHGAIITRQDLETAREKVKKAKGDLHHITMRILVYKLLVQALTPDHAAA